MRTLWKGSISFGLVNVPIKMYTATSKESLSFRQLHNKCNSPITYQKYCPKCDQVVGSEDIVSGYEYEKGKYVILKDEDFDNIPVASTRTIDIVDFVDLSEIDPVFYSKSYYLSPNEGGEKAYILLSQALKETQKVAVAKITIRDKESLACIRVLANGTICLETMYFPAEVRDSGDLRIGDLVGKIKISDAEMTMATQLISSLSTHFTPEKYTDEYSEALLQVIRQKVEGAEVQVPERAVSGKVVDLMDALRASLELAQKERENVKAAVGHGERDTETGAAEERAPEKVAT